MLKFGVRKGLFFEKVPTEKMGGLVVFQIHLKKVQTLGFFYVHGREERRTERRLTPTDIWAPAGVPGRWC